MAVYVRWSREIILISYYFIVLNNLKNGKLKKSIQSLQFDLIFPPQTRNFSKKFVFHFIMVWFTFISFQEQVEFNTNIFRNKAIIY